MGYYDTPSLIYVSMINHKSEIPQYRFSIEAPEK